MKNKYYLFGSIFIFLISLILPVYLNSTHIADYYFNDNSIENLGVFYLVIGYITIAELPVEFFCWLSNFTLLFAWIFHKKKSGVVLVWISFVLMFAYAINYLFRLDIILVVEYDEFLFGYWFWLASPILMLCYHYLPEKGMKEKNI